MTENKAPRTPEDILWMTLRDIQTQSSAAHSGYSRQADTLIRALTEAGYHIVPILSSPAEFYQLPAHQLRPGMSTADGQDIIDVEPAGDLVLYHTYTPRSDDPGQDEDNYSMPDGRVSPRDELIDLAVFPDTEVDGRIS